MSHIETWIVDAPDAAVAAPEASLLTPDEDAWVAETLLLGEGATVRLGYRSHVIWYGKFILKFTFHTVKLTK